MSDPYFQQLFANRIGGENYGKGTDIYKFEKIKRAKRKALNDFPDRLLLDGIGENDSPADEAVRMDGSGNPQTRKRYMLIMVSLSSRTVLDSCNGT